MSIPPERRDTRLMREMFGTIAPRYDLITRLFSFGMDMGWKELGVRTASLPDKPVILDLACGTGDFSKITETERPGAISIAADITFGMVERARHSGVQRGVCADAMRLPFADNTFDCVFVGYGLRNFPQLAQSIAEIERVTKPGGLLVSLDFFQPDNVLFKRLYLSYLYVQGAMWGFVLHGRPRIYTYIPDSIAAFMSMKDLTLLLKGLGYGDVRSRGFILGGIGVHWAQKARAA